MQTDEERKYEVNYLIRKLKKWRSNIFFHIEYMIKQAFISKDWEESEKYQTYSFNTTKSINISRSKSEQKYDNDLLLIKHVKDREILYKEYNDRLEDLENYSEQNDWKALIIEAEKTIASDILDKLNKMYSIQRKEARRSEKSAPSLEYIINNFKREKGSKFSDGYSFKVVLSEKTAFFITYIVHAIGFIYFFKTSSLSQHVIVLGSKILILTFLGYCILKLIFRRKAFVNIYYNDIKIRRTTLLSKRTITIPWSQIDFFSEEEKKNAYHFSLSSKNKELVKLRIPKREDSSSRDEEYDMFLTELKSSFELPSTAKHIQGKQMRYLSFWDKWVLGKKP